MERRRRIFCRKPLFLFMLWLDRTMTMTNVTDPVLRWRKGGWVRPWLVVNSMGQAEVVEAGDHQIMQRTGLPFRDLLTLDLDFAGASTILGRDRAILINLDHIKSIITSQQMIFLISNHPFLAPFLHNIQRIFRHHSQESGEENASGDSLLPFELVALKACLASTCTSLDDEATRLEEEAHPALNKLKSDTNTLNFDQVRRIKSSLMSMIGRVQKVRDTLSDLLDDDEDMAKMCLSKNLDNQQLNNSSTSSWKDLIIDDEYGNYAEKTMVIHRSCDASDIDIPKELDHTNRRQNNQNHSSSNTETLDIEGLEMLLLAYYVQIEGTLNKLYNVRDKIDYTEGYVNIMWDYKLNRLMQMTMVLYIAALVVSTFNAVLACRKYY